MMIIRSPYNKGLSACKKCKKKTNQRFFYVAESNYRASAKINVVTCRDNRMACDERCVSRRQNAAHFPSDPFSIFCRWMGQSCVIHINVRNHIGFLRFGSAKHATLSSNISSSGLTTVTLRFHRKSESGDNDCREYTRSAICTWPRLGFSVQF